jgi:hypothetical protein
MKNASSLIWDLPLRLFHWSWALAFLACWLTRGDPTLYFHVLAGYIFSFLLLFRLVWGFVGCREGRFRAFLYGPKKLAGVLVESYLQRENLPLSMFTGYRRNGSGANDTVPPRLGVALALFIALLLFAVSWLRPWFPREGAEPFLAFPGPQLARDSLWEEECGGCHLAYHPSLLPAASWRFLLATQSDHFEEDLSLDGETLAALAAYAFRHAAETTPTEAAWKLLHSIGEDSAPARITEIPYWREKHARIEAALWSAPAVNGRYNCDACHRDAPQGWFADSAMTLPSRPIARQFDHTGGNF